MHSVRVNLAEDSYDIFIGEEIVSQLRAFVAAANFSRKALVVSDDIVGKIYGEKMIDALRAAGLDAELFLIKSGESSKRFAVAETLYTKAIAMGLDRNSAIFALGGGVVGDLTGFVAATYLRGVPFVQLPTSLLAQVDSSVGGKVAINHVLGKNLIGAFYQPRAVFMALSMLESLPSSEIRAGLAEIIKYGIIEDAVFFDDLVRDAEDILALRKSTLAYIIARSCEIKAQVVSGDERENGRRIILNFGHTIAHAIENETGYARYSHGEAVAIGMHGAARISYYLGLVTQEEAQAVTHALQMFHLPVAVEGCAAENLFKILFRDKKAVNGSIRWVLMERIGSVKVVPDVPDDVVLRVLREITGECEPQRN